MMVQRSSFKRAKKIQVDLEWPTCILEKNQVDAASPSTKILADVIVFFRLGDFCETFDDARNLRLLSIDWNLLGEQLYYICQGWIP